MRITARWECLDDPPTSCTSCGADLTPYLPRCVVCQTPTAPATREIDFAPNHFERPEGAVRVMHLSDLHVGQPLPEERLKPMAALRIWLERVRLLDASVLVVSGDLVERPGDVYGMRRVHALLDDLEIPWVVVPGNHDLKRPGYHDPFFDIFGDFPRVETHANIDFVLFDSMAGLPLEERDVAERMYGDYVCYTEGRVGHSQYEQAERALAGKPPRPRVVVLHHHVMRQHADLMPLTPKQAGITEDIFGTMKALMDADQLFDWSSTNRVHTILHGHKHLFQQPGMRAHNLLVLNAGSSTLRVGHQLGRFIDFLPGRRIVSNVELMV